jgi:hypothetical protein
LYAQKRSPLGVEPDFNLLVHFDRFGLSEHCGISIVSGRQEKGEERQMAHTREDLVALLPPWSIRCVHRYEDVPSQDEENEVRVGPYIHDPPDRSVIVGDPLS